MRMFSSLVQELICLSACLSLFGSGAAAQTAQDLNHGLRLGVASTPQTYEVSWWGKPQRKYYVEMSDDMVNWTYMPVIEWGTGAPLQWNFYSSQPRKFVRLQHEDAPTYMPSGTTWGAGGSTFNQNATPSTGMTAASWPAASYNTELNPLPSSPYQYFNTQVKKANLGFEGTHIYLTTFPPAGKRVEYDSSRGTLNISIPGHGYLNAEVSNDALHSYSAILAAAAAAETLLDATWVPESSPYVNATISRTSQAYHWEEPGPPVTTGSEVRDWDSGGSSDSLVRLSCTRPALHERRQHYWFLQRVNDTASTYHYDALGTVSFVIPAGQQESTEVVASSGIPTQLGVATGGTYRLLAPAVQDFGLIHSHSLQDAYTGYLPDALPVNSDFDEKKLGAHGFAIPDCEDASLIAAQGVDVGKIITRDMWTGYFGLSPALIPNPIRQSAGTPVVTIERVIQEGDEQEEGEVRMHIISQAVSNGSGPFTTQAVELVADENAAPIDLSEWYNEAMVGKWRSSFEGTKPGAVTLKFTYDKGSHHYEHEQTFEVCTQKTTSQWLAEIKDQILLQTGGRADLGNYLPAAGWQPSKNFVHHTREVAIIYEYYAQLFRQYPDKADWMGIAHMTGCAVYAGLSDAQQHGAGNVTKPIMGGQVLIYKDTAWPYRAYIASGLGALKWVKANNDVPANGVSGTGALDIEVWTQFDSAWTSGNYAAMQVATTAITTREQAEIIKPMWDYLEQNHSGIVTGMGNASKNTVDPDSPTFLEVMRVLTGNQSGNSYTFRISDSAWRLKFCFDDPQNPPDPEGPPSDCLFPIWWGLAPTQAGVYLNTAGRLSLVQIPLATRAAAFTTLSIYPP